MKKIVLLILVIVFLVGCASFNPFIRENDRVFDSIKSASVADIQADAERIGKEELAKGEIVEIRYIGTTGGEEYYTKLFYSKDGRWQFAGWLDNKAPSKELQNSWKPERVIITTYYRPCR